MDSKERRHCQRYQMNYPIIVSSSRAIDNEKGWHYGKILDACKNGIRMRVDNFGALRVGSRLQLICQPVRNKGPNNDCLPVPIQGVVVWTDPGAHEFALRYISRTAGALYGDNPLP